MRCLRFFHFVSVLLRIFFAQDYSGEVLRRQSLKSSGGWLSTWNKAGFFDLFPKSMGGFRGAPKRWAWWHFSSPNWQYNIYHVYLIVLAFWGVICYLPNPPFRGTRNNYWTSLWTMCSMKPQVMPSGPNPDITLREVCYHECLEWLETFWKPGCYQGSWKEDGDVWFQKFCLPDRLF